MDLIGKQLPSVSEADNGKFLGVDSGRWQAVPVQKADLIYIPYPDLNYSSIQAALAAEQRPFTQLAIDGNEYTFYLMQNLLQSDPAKFVFVSVAHGTTSHTYLTHFLNVSENIKDVNNITFYDIDFVNKLNTKINNLTSVLALKQLPVTVSGTTATLDLTNEGGIQAMMLNYAAGHNYLFVVVNLQTSPNNILVFTPCGMDTSTANMHMDLSCISNGLAYYVRLTPIDTNVMRGTLNTYQLTT